MGGKANKLRRKKGTPRSPLERMAIAWQLIRTRNLPNCTSLAKRMGVDPKTVSRDLEFLRDRLGAQFEYDPRTRGYVATSPESRECFFCGAVRGRISNSPRGC